MLIKFDRSYHLSTTQNWATFTKGSKWDFTVDLPIELGGGLDPVPVEIWSPYLEAERQHFIASLAKKDRSLAWLKKNANQRRGQTFRPQKPKNIADKQAHNRRAYLAKVGKDDDTWCQFPDYDFPDPEIEQDMRSMLFPVDLPVERKTHWQPPNKKWLPLISVKKAETVAGKIYLTSMVAQHSGICKKSMLIAEKRQVFYCLPVRSPVTAPVRKYDTLGRRKRAFLTRKAGARAHQGVVFRAWKRSIYNQKKEVIAVGVASDWVGCW